MAAEELVMFPETEINPALADLKDDEIRRLRAQVDALRADLTLSGQRIATLERRIEALVNEKRAESDAEG